MVGCWESPAGVQDPRLVAGFRTSRRVSGERQSTPPKGGTADAIFGLGLLPAGLGGRYIVHGGIPDGRRGVAENHAGGADDPRKLLVMAGNGRRLSAGAGAVGSQDRKRAGWGKGEDF